MTRRWRSTIRMRLTLLYAATFFLAGALLITLSYIYLKHLLNHQPPLQPGAADGLTAELLRDADAHSASRLHEAFQAQFEQVRDETLRAMLIWSGQASAPRPHHDGWTGHGHRGRRPTPPAHGDGPARCGLLDKRVGLAPPAITPSIERSPTFRGLVTTPFAVTAASWVAVAASAMRRYAGRIDRAD